MKIWSRRIAQSMNEKIWKILPWILKAEFLNFFVYILGNATTSYFHSEISLPLTSDVVGHNFVIVQSTFTTNWEPFFSCTGWKLPPGWLPKLLSRLFAQFIMTTSTLTTCKTLPLTWRTELWWVIHYGNMGCGVSRSGIPN